MDKKILGIDFSDTGAVLSFYSDSRKWCFPSAVCKEKDRRGWLVGRAAFECALNGSGIITDKLLSFIDKKKITTLHGVRYSALDLVSGFFRAVFHEVTADAEAPDFVVVCVPEISVDIVNSLTDCICRAGINKECIYVISRSEAFIYYSMSQAKDFHNNNVALFSLEDNALTYYEMKIQRKPKSTLVFADKELMDESFNTEITTTEAGAKLADKILLSCVDRLFKNKIISAVILTGKGFQSLDWAPEFTKAVCHRRKVFVDDEIFARGAGYRGADLASENGIFQFSPICDGRIDCSIYITINKKDRTVAYPVINIGDPWFSVDRRIKVIPTSMQDIELSVVPMDERMRRTLRIPIGFMPERPPKTSCIGLGIHFTNAHDMTVDIEDLGFGDIYPATHLKQTQEVTLWG